MLPQVVPLARNPARHGGVRRFGSGSGTGAADHTGRGGGAGRSANRHPVQPSHGTVGPDERRADEVAVQIEPALPCHWRWLNVSALACQLDADQALLPATRYRVTVAAGFAAADGARLARQVVHEFVTERPRLEQAYVSAWRGPGSPVLRLQFNLPVTRQSVEQALRFQPAGGEPVGPVLGEISSGRPRKARRCCRCRASSFSSWRRPRRRSRKPARPGVIGTSCPASPWPKAWRSICSCGPA